MKKLPMQDWAHADIERDLKEAQERFGPYFEANDLELVPLRLNGSWTFYIKRKRPRKRASDHVQNLADDVKENLEIWNSGLLLNLVDFAIALENLRDFVQEMQSGNPKKPDSIEGDSAPSPC